MDGPASPLYESLFCKNLGSNLSPCSGLVHLIKCSCMLTGEVVLRFLFKLLDTMMTLWSHTFPLVYKELERVTLVK